MTPLQRRQFMSECVIETWAPESPLEIGVAITHGPTTMRESGTSDGPRLLLQERLIHKLWERVAPHTTYGVEAVEVDQEDSQELQTGDG